MGHPADAMLEARNVRLVPLQPEHLPHLRTFELSDELAFRWRHSGAHPNPDQFAISTFGEALCSFLILSTSGAPMGLVVAYSADLRNGHCRVAATRFGTRRSPSPSFMRAMYLAVEYLFKGWPFRKVYFEVPDFNMHQFRSGLGRLLRLEGTLSEHVYLDRRYWDLHFISISRGDWEVEWLRVQPFVSGKRGGG
jgi:hypothetical protein